MEPIPSVVRGIVILNFFKESIGTPKTSEEKDRKNVQKQHSDLFPFFTKYLLHVHKLSHNQQQF